MSGKFKGWEDLRAEYGNIAWIDYLSLISAIPENWKLLLKSELDGEQTECVYNTIFTVKNVTRFIYDRLINNDRQVVSYWSRWNDVGITISYEDYLRSFANLYKCTKIVKYCEFHYRFLLYKIVTQSELFKWGKCDSDKCTFCGVCTETVRHLFLDCHEIQCIIKWVVSLADKSNIEVNVTPAHWLITGIHDNPFHILNFLAIFCK